MALKRRTQIQAKAQDVPGTAATSFAGSNVVEVLEAEFSESRSLIDRRPATSSMSNPKKAVGAGTSTLNFGVEWRGGRTNGVPDFDLLLQACGLRSAGARTFTLDGGGELSEAVKRGHILQGDTSLARCMVTEDAASSDGTFKGIILTPDIAFDAADNLDNLSNGSDGIASYASDAAITGAAGYHPVSVHRLQMTLASGTWTGDTPAAGDGITFSSGGTAIGGGIIVSLSGTQLVVEITWGTVSASNTILATGYGATSGTNSLSASPAFSQVIWPYVTVRHNEHNHQRALEDAVGTFNLSGEAGAAVQGTMEFTGKKGAWGEDDFLIPGTRNTKSPPLMQKTGNATFTVGSVQLPIVSFDFSQGMESVVARDANRTEGIHRTESTARNPTLSVTIQRVPTSTIDWETLWQNGTLQRIAIVADGGTNNGVMLLAPAAQISNVSHGEDSGLITDTLELELTGTVDDDEFALFFGTV